MNAAALDQIITDLLTKTGSEPVSSFLSETTVRELLRAVVVELIQDPVLIRLSGPVVVAGDTHGQFTAILSIFQQHGYPDTTKYLFLGDYVDRGKESIELMTLLFAYKVRYPKNIFLLRGNHECQAINRIYGFFDQCKRDFTIRIWKGFNDAFNHMPVAALIGNEIFCVHGGISPDLSSWDAIESIERPTDIPDSGLLTDLMWTCPEKNLSGWDEASRVGFVFGEDVVHSFVARFGLKLICRCHQVVDGYEFFAQEKLVTIFSAPNYCGEFDNAGAVMLVDSLNNYAFATFSEFIKSVKSASNVK